MLNILYAVEFIHTTLTLHKFTQRICSVQDNRHVHYMLVKFMDVSSLWTW